MILEKVQYLLASIDKDSRKPSSTQWQDDTGYRDNGFSMQQECATLSKGAAALDCVRRFSVSGLVGGFSGMSRGNACFQDQGTGATSAP